MTAIEARPSSIPPEGRVVGIDLGARRVGVAVCDGGQRLATGVSMIERSPDRVADRRAIAAVVADYDAVGVVVGLPRSLSGGLGPAARAAQAEIDALRAVLGVPVDATDERFSTVTAARHLRAGGRAGRQQRRIIDQTAAAVLLQAWLDGRRGGG